MAIYLVDKTGCPGACQKPCEELAAILWIQLKINGSCRRGQIELLLDRSETHRGTPLARTTRYSVCPHVFIADDHLDRNSGQNGAAHHLKDAIH
jgi:hypothetical protein